MDKFNVGDLVLSVAGRDLNHAFIVIKIEGNYAYVVDGKIHKAQNPKKKKFKHIKLIKSAILLEIACKISCGCPIKNGTIIRAISTAQKLNREE